MRKTIAGLPKNEYERQYRQKNREKINKRTRENYARNKDAINAKKREYFPEAQAAMKQKIYDLLGGAVCKRCGFDDKRALQIDHINGGGKQERKKIHNLFTFYRHILKVNGKGYQILCANCNWIKRHENNEHR